LENLTVFSIKGTEIPLSALPAGSTQSEWTTILEEVKDLDKNISNYRWKVMANLVPRDLKELKSLEARIA
jgi:hypothetical protein